MRYGMVIDLLKCVGCNACTVACRAENGTPTGVHFNKIKKYEVGKYPSAKMKFLPMPCMHCQNTPCLKACPTGATAKNQQGIITVNEDNCIGCRACVVACPYESRYFLWDFKPYYEGQNFTPFETLKQKKYVKGTVVKCEFCTPRLEQGKLPACVETCPGQARYFGDLDDPNSEVSKLVALHKGMPLRPELGTEPSVIYIRG